MLPRPMLTMTLATLLIAGAGGASLQGIALAQQGPLLTSVFMEDLPEDPGDAAWEQAPALDVPLTPQAVALPRLLQLSVPVVSVRSLHDGRRISFRLEWSDPTRDVRATRPDEFRDAAAIMLPVGEFLPNICMGSPGQLTNLWHWKADWQEDIDQGFQDVVDAYPHFYKDSYPFVSGQPPYRAPADFGSAEARQYLIGLAAGNPLARPDRTSPVEELLATGFGTATHKPGQAVQGKGVWADGRWQVLFTRALAPDGPDSASLTGREVSAAFAVWNGSNQEVGARKQLSSLVTVAIAPRPLSAAPAPTPMPPAGKPAFSEREFMVTAAIVAILGGAALVGWWGRARELRRGPR